MARVIIVIALSLITIRSHSQGFATVTNLSPFTATKNSGEKPQSKVWQYDGKWWCVFPDSTGTYILRLDGTSWTKTLRIASNSVVKADCKVVDSVCHIFLWKKADSPSRFVSVEYVQSSQNYKLWSSRSSSVLITLDPGTETGTIDIDATGRMWLVSDGINDIRARWSDPPYSTWSAPIVIASGVKDDDIGSVINMPVQGQVGVFWSNQNTKRFGFKTHTNGTDPTVWSADELPASQSALDIGMGFSDDHLNLAVASDGTLYCAVKTGYDEPGYPLVALLKRQPNGTWDNLYEISDIGTRPIVLLNEAAGKLKVVYSSREGGSDIVYRESPFPNISFGSVNTLISGGLYDNATSTKDNYNGEIVILASDLSNIVGVIGRDNPPTTIPPPPGLLDPPDLSASVIVDSTFSWQASTGADSYELQLALSSDFSSLFYSEANITSTTVQPDTVLDYGTRYFWRVRASNAAGSSNWSAVWSFTTENSPPELPSAPTLLSPSDLATDVVRDTVLSWQAATGADSYELQLALSSDFSSLFYSEANITSTSFQPDTVLDYGTRYFWRVRGVNIAGPGDWSTVWSFTTESLYVNQLVAFWKMDEGSGVIINDDSGQGNNGQTTGSPVWVPGVRGEALKLNGSNQNAIVQDSPSLDISSGITLAAWIRPEKKAFQQIVFKGDNRTDGYALSLLKNGRVSFAINQNTSGSYKISSNRSYPVDGTWMHIAGTFNGTVLKLFINGIEDKTVLFTSPSLIGINNLPLVIGAADNATNFFKGTLDEVEIYNYTLSASEISAVASGDRVQTSIARIAQPESIEQAPDQENIEEPNSEMDIYPNPAENTLLVPLFPASENIILISDIYGHVFYKTITTGGKDLLIIDLDPLHIKSGLYLLLRQSSDSRIISKFFKK